MTHPRGITTLEILLVIALMAVLSLISIASFSRLQKTSANTSSDREIATIMTLAARRARSGHSGSSWGVYLTYDETTRAAQSATLFSGTSYATRTTALDIIYPLAQQIKLTSVDFSGTSPDVTNSHEIVFQYLTGNTTQYGSIIFEWFDQQRTLTVPSHGIPVRN